MLTSESEIKVVGMRRLEGDGPTKAFVEIAFGEVLTVRSARVVSGKKGLFVSMPQERGRDGKWYPIVTLLNDDIKGGIEQMVLTKYEEEIQPAEA